MSRRRQTLTAAVAVALALTVVLGGQALADVAAPEVPNGTLTGQAMGRAGFAYLTGLRKFGAALLWNRLEPQMHQYYGGHPGLGKITFMLPSIEAIVTLDPQFVQAYFVAPGIIVDSGKLPGVPADVAAERLKTGLDLAKQGIEDNPKSGLLLASYAQLLATERKDVPAALPFAVAGIADDIYWSSDEEKFNSYAVFRAIFKLSGDTAREAFAKSVMDAIAANPNATMDPSDGDE